MIFELLPYFIHKLNILLLFILHKGELAKAVCDDFMGNFGFVLKRLQDSLIYSVFTQMVLFFCSCLFYFQVIIFFASMLFPGTLHLSLLQRYFNCVLSKASLESEKSLPIVLSCSDCSSILPKQIVLWQKLEFRLEVTAKYLIQTVLHGQKNCFTCNRLKILMHFLSFFYLTCMFVPFRHTKMTSGYAFLDFWNKPTCLLPIEARTRNNGCVVDSSFKANLKKNAFLTKSTTDNRNIVVNSAEETYRKFKEYLSYLRGELSNEMQFLNEIDAEALHYGMKDLTLLGTDDPENDSLPHCITNIDVVFALRMSVFKMQKLMLSWILFLPLTFYSNKVLLVALDKQFEKKCNASGIGKRKNKSKVQW
ncbi:hypothetical protein EGR_10530 [Echinococcus granulosus]|uniref:Uncharacterized protein n=1 Tax=Echinococcus granulosus TaxID=6210 RepID=W6UM89_ECHGR|nr:hypothetical protein EGR_10530 [Echinococcus granulosus]EUB54609.1 hypothetical protein EGR_10530 [Echinococcus granulosus]